MKSILIYILLAILLMWFLTAGGMNLSYDSTHYLVAGDLFSHGKFKQALDKIFPHHAPFYSLVLASTQLLTGGAIEGKDRRPVKKFIVRNVPWARLVVIFGFTLTVMGMFLLGWHSGGSVTAHLSAGLTLIFSPLVNIFTWVWSETLFLPISIFCLLALFLYTKKRSIFWLLFSAVLAGLAFFTRFIGISLILTGSLVVLFVIENPKQLVRIIPWNLIACSPVLLYLRIHRVTGPAPHGFFYQLLEFLKISLRDFGPIAVLVMVLGLILEVLRWKDGEKVRIWWGVVLYVLMYSGILLIVCSSIWIDPLDSHFSRLNMPIYPFLLLFVSVALTGLYKTPERPFTETYHYEG